MGGLSCAPRARRFSLSGTAPPFRGRLQARGGRETPVTEEEARVIFRARGDVGRGRATFQARARGRGGRATASPALASKGGEKLSRRGKKAVAKEAGEVVSREEGEAIYRATLESLLASTGLPGEQVRRLCLTGVSSLSQRCATNASQ